MALTIKDYIATRQPAAAPQEPAPTGRRVRDYIRDNDKITFGEFQEIYRTPIDQPRREEREANADFNRIRKDLERMGQGNIEAVENWQKVAETLVRLKGADDEEANSLANSYLQQYGEQLRPHIELVAGEDWWDQNYEEAPRPGGIQGALGAVLGNPVVETVLGVLDRPSQAVLHGIRGIGAALDEGDDGVSTAEGLRYAASSIGRMLDPTENFGARTISTAEGQVDPDVDDDGVLNLREALGQDPDEGGRWVGLLDTIGVIALDPLTYATFGGAGLARGGMQAILRQSGKHADEGMRALGQMIHGTIARRGAREVGEEALDRSGRLVGLTPYHRQLAEQWIREDVAESYAALAAREADPARRAKLSTQARRMAGRAEKSAEQRAAEMWRAVERGGRSGVRVAGRTVVPYSPVLRLLEGLKIAPSYTAAVANGIMTGAEALDEMVTTAPVVVKEAGRAASAVDFGDINGAMALLGEIGLINQNLRIPGQLAALNQRISTLGRIGIINQNLDIQNTIARINEGLAAGRQIDRAELDELTEAVSETFARSMTPEELERADNALAQYVVGRTSRPDAEIQLDLLEEIADNPVLRSQLGITDQDIVDLLDARLLPPQGSTAQIGQRFRHLEAGEWIEANEAAGRRVPRKNAKPSGELPPAAAATVDEIVPELGDLRRVEPTANNLRRLTRPEMARINKYMRVDRRMTQTEKRMLLELEDRGFEPFFDEAADAYKVTAGDTTYTITRQVPKPGQKVSGTYLTPEASAGTVLYQAEDPVLQRIQALRDRLTQPRTLPMAAEPRIRGMLDDAVNRSTIRQMNETGERLAETIPPSPGRIGFKNAQDLLDDTLTASTIGRPSRFDEAVPASLRPFTPLADDIADGALDTVDDAVELIETAGRRYVVTYNEGIFDKLYDTRFMRMLRHKFIPRARIIDDERRQLGRRVAQQMDDNMAEHVGTFATSMDDLTAELHSNVITAGREALGARFDELMGRALSSKEGYADVVRELKKMGEAGRVGRETLEEMMRIRAELATIAAEVGMMPFSLDQLQYWMPTRLAQQVNEAVKNLSPEQLQRLERTGFINPRTGRVSEQRVRSAIDKRARLVGATPKEDLISANSEAADILRSVGLEPEVLGDLFVPDVIENFLYTARQAFEKKIELDLMDSLVGEGITRSGHKLAYKLDQSVDDFSEDAARKELAEQGVPTTEYQTVPVGPHLYIVQTPIYKEYEEIRRVLRDKNSVPEIVQMVNKWNGLWSTYATVPIISGFTYHSRNIIGNLFNSFLGGVRNPARYAEAFRVQRTYGRAMAYMRKHGGNFDNALQETGASARHASILKAARAQNVIGTGQTADVFNEVLFQKQKRRATQWVNPIDQRNVVTSSGRALGTAIEDNARIAMFINGLENGLSPQLAARDVRKFLFDYSDLTKFEHDTMRTLSRFYTFMRKNTALQAQMLVLYPGRVVNAQRVAEQWTEMWVGQDESEGFYGQMPPWMRGGATERIATIGGLQGTVSLETPLIAAAETTEKLGAVLSVVPVLGEAVPEAMAWGTVEQRMGRAMSLLAGGPVEAVDLMYGERFARDPFSGAQLSMDTTSRLVRGLNTVFPIVGRVESQGFLTGTLKNHWVDGDTENGAQFRSLSALLGFTTYAFTEDRQQAGLNALRYEAYEALQALEDSGTEIPTLDELIEAGKINAQNQALTLMLRYEATTDPEDKARLRQSLESLVGGPVLDAGGILRQTMNNPEATQAEKELRIQEMRTSLEFLREQQGLPPLTEDEWGRVLLASSFVPDNAELERIGLEPERTSNVFDTPEQTRATENQIRAEFEWAAQQFGLDPGRVAAMRPLLTDAERVLQDAAARGLPREAAVEYLISELGRKEQGLIFGTDTLAAYRDGTLTLSQEVAARNRAWQRASEFAIIFSSVTGRMPTEDETWKYVYWNELTNTQLDSVGFERAPRIPSAKDIRTDADKTRDAMREAMAVRMGVLEGPG